MGKNIGSGSTASIGRLVPFALADLTGKNIVRITFAVKPATKGHTCLDEVKAKAEVIKFALEIKVNTV